MRSAGSRSGAGLQYSTSSWPKTRISIATRKSIRASEILIISRLRLLRFPNGSDSITKRSTSESRCAFPVAREPKRTMRSGATVEDDDLDHLVEHFVGNFKHAPHEFMGH